MSIFDGTAPKLDLGPEKKLTAKQLSKTILESSEYRRSLERRIAADALPAAVECRLYDYAYGKPVDRVEIKDTTDRLEDLTDAELEARIAALGAKVASLRSKGDGTGADTPVPIEQVH